MAGQDNLLDSLLNPGGVADGLAGDAVIAETGDYRLWIDSDKLKLQLLVRKKYLPETGECVERSEQEAAFLAEAIHQQIERAGVVGQPTGWGEKIWQALENPDLPVVVVSGTPPVEGEDGQVVIHFRLEADRRPQAEENEKIDYRELSPFVIASADDLLADIIPPTEGIAGQDVFGQILPAKPGKPAKIGLGDNVRCQDNKVYAEITGQVALIDDKINVSPILVISEDVDYETGNINFTGSVLVRGAVQPGFTVTASGSVEVDGSVAGAVVAGNEVVLLRGVNGGKITAKKSVRAKFIENAEVTAGEDIFVSDYIMHSTVRAGRKIVVVEGKGLIVGGVVMAGEELEMRVAGTEAGAVTDLQAGVRPELREEMVRVSSELTALVQTIEKSKKAIKLLKEMEQIRDLPPDKKELLLSLTRSSFRQEWQREQLIRAKFEIESKLNDLPRGRIKIRLKGYPGVKLTIGTRTKRLMEEVSYALYYLKDNEIRLGTLR